MGDKINIHISKTIYSVPDGFPLFITEDIDIPVPGKFVCDVIAGKPDYDISGKWKKGSFLGGFKSLFIGKIKGTVSLTGATDKFTYVPDDGAAIVYCIDFKTETKNFTIPIHDEAMVPGF